MTRCDECAQCVHGRPKGGWPKEMGTWVEDCRDFNKAVVIIPFGGYKDFDECVSKNQDKADPKAYCGKIKHDTEGKDMEHPTRFQTRALNLPLVRDNFQRLDGGGLRVKNITALAEGEWTDSAVGTPLFYPARVLERDHGKWAAQGIWSRHTGGTSRSVTDKVGIIENPRYSAELKAVVVDGLFHGKTQASRDVIELIDNEIVTDVSAEVGVKEVWNAETKRYEAVSSVFYGLATVDRGACNVCKMKRNEASECEKLENEERNEMEVKELEGKIAALETEKVELSKKAEADIAELTKKLETVSKSREDEMAASKAAAEESAKQLAEAMKKIEELEKLAQKPKTLPGTGEGGNMPTAQLEVLTPATIRNGEVSR